MSTKQGLKAISGILTLCITLPIWYRLIYVMLTAIHADGTTWFLFWIYLPVGIVASIISKLTEVTESGEKSA